MATPKDIFFQLRKEKKTYQFQQINADAFRGKPGFYRKAKRSIPELKITAATYNDTSFPFDASKEGVDEKGNPFSIGRLIQYYPKPFGIFQPQYCKDEFIDKQDSYPSFVTELAAIDKVYLKTLFITQKINPDGYYEYFVRRNGEYFVECMDDKIPINSVTKLPAWGLSKNEPWTLLVMKAWIKENKGIKGVVNAEPFSFLDAFGMPGYRALSIQKDIEFVRASRGDQQSKTAKQDKISLFRPNYVTIAKTRDSEQVRKMGIQKNRAGYLIYNYDDKRKSNLISEFYKVHDQQPIFKVRSSVESYWIGGYSVKESKLVKKEYKAEMHRINLEREFLADYSELVSVFSRFYSSPDAKSMLYSGNFMQDFIKVEHKGLPKVFLIDVLTSGYLNFNVDLPVSSKKMVGRHTRYAPIKYFMAKVRLEEQSGKRYNINRVHNFDIEYVKGYHKSCNNFLQISEGTYYVYVDIDNSQGQNGSDYVVSINTSTQVKAFHEIVLSQQIFSKFVRSFFCSYSIENGKRAFIGESAETSTDLSIFFDNCFDYIGFGYITLTNRLTASQDLVMKISLKIMRDNNIKIIHSGSYKEDEDGNWWFRVKSGHYHTIVLETIQRKNIRMEVFPPLGAVQFFEIRRS